MTLKFPHRVVRVERKEPLVAYRERPAVLHQEAGDRLHEQPGDSAPRDCGAGDGFIGRPRSPDVALCRVSKEMLVSDTKTEGKESARVRDFCIEFGRKLLHRRILFDVFSKFLSMGSKCVEASMSNKDEEPVAGL